MDQNQPSPHRGHLSSATAAQVADQIFARSHVPIRFVIGTPHFLRAHLAVQQKLINAPMTMLVRTNQGELSPVCVSVFDLSADEKFAIERELLNVRDQIDALCAANVESVGRSSPTSVVVKFKLFPEAGGKVYDQFVAQLAHTLGAERFAGLKTLMGDGFESTFGGGFGAEERSFTIQRQSSGPADKPRIFYAILDRISPPATDRIPTVGQYGVIPKISTSITQFTRATLNERYPWLAPLLPEDF